MQYRNDKAQAKSDRRVAQRYEGHFRVRFKSIPTFRAEFRANISVGGLFVHTEKPIPIDGLVAVDLIPAEGVEAFELHGKVVRISKSPPGIGVQFLNLTPDVLDRIERIISEDGTPVSDRRTPEPELEVPTVVVNYSSTGELVEDMLVNFSSSGGFVKTDSPLEDGTEILLKIRPADKRVPDLELMALVLDSGQEAPDGQKGMFVKFLTSRSKDMATLKTFARSLRTAMDAKR